MDPRPPSPHPLRVLFAGGLDPFLTTGARLAALRELGITVEALDSDAWVRSEHRWVARLNHHTLLTPAIFAFNRALLAAFERFEPDAVWLEKPVFVFPRTLRRMRRRPGVALVYHNTDDWRARVRLHRLHWRFLLRTLPAYDLHVTSNLHNVAEFRAAGFARVHHMELAANPAIRDPGPIPEAERRRLGGPVGFIGHWEPATERSLAHLCAAGIPLAIYGGGWRQARAPVLAQAIRDRLVWGDEYARAICSFDVNLGIVSKVNRNHTASRTFQIPALGAFLLHERNEVVSRCFREGVEAEFFGSDEELVTKCRHYLEHPGERRRIAEAGRRRCIESGYFEVDRMREVLPLLQEAVAAARARAQERL